MTRILLLFPLVAACTSGTPGTDDTAPSYTEGGPFYYPEARQALDAHCIRCHAGEGPGIGDFTDTDVAVPLAERMLERIQAGTMPPPTSDPDCHDYQGADHLNVSDAAVQVIADWIDNGKPLGNPDDYTPTNQIRTELDDFNLEIGLPASYVPSFTDAANPNNEYRCFAIDHGQTENFYINAMAPALDQRGIIHHIVAYTLQEDDVPEHDPNLGWDCINDASPGAGMLAGWAPGAVPVEFEAGTGLQVRPQDRIVLQMHYYAAGPEFEGKGDQSGYRFKTLTSDELTRRVIMMPLGVYSSFVIPAGDPAFTVGEDITIPGIPLDIDATVNIHGTFPHMHRSGSAYQAGVIDGETGADQCVVRSEGWEFDNQLTYMFDEPVVVRPGDSVYINCTYDNSSDNPSVPQPPVDIHDGERTDEEMCFAFTFLSTDPPGLVNLIDEYL